jgi:hypothetical protein
MPRSSDERIESDSAAGFGAAEVFDFFARGPDAFDGVDGIATLSAGASLRGLKND